MIRFSSKAGADVWMLDEHGRRMLELLGKDPGAKQGVVTAEDLPAASQRLRAAVSAEPAQAHAVEDDDDEASNSEQAVSLSQRAYPLLELMEQAQAKGKDVLWGW